MKVYLIITLLHFISPLMLEMSKKKLQHCYTKTLKKPDNLYFSFLVSSFQKKTLTVVFTDMQTKRQIYKGINATIEYKSEILPQGDYQLCFQSTDKSVFLVSFQFYSFSENGIIKELALDKEVKYMIQGVNELKESFHSFEKNFKYIVDRRTKHNQILNDIISSVKNLTLLKIFVVLFLSIFQVFIIEKFFGPDKRVSSVKGAFSEKL